MHLGSNIANKRKERKLSQEFVAQQLGVSRQAVSKWESGQTEPTAKNLVALAQLFGISVSELLEQDFVKSEECSPVNNPPEASSWKHKFPVITVGAYSGFAILSTVQTNDPYFLPYVSLLILLAAIVMVINIARLPSDIRPKMAIAELIYCIVIYCTAAFLPSRIGNVFTSGIILLLCVLYAKYIRFKDYP